MFVQRLSLFAFFIWFWYQLLQKEEDFHRGSFIPASKILPPPLSPLSLSLFQIFISFFINTLTRTHTHFSRTHVHTHALSFFLNIWVTDLSRSHNSICRWKIFGFCAHVIIILKLSLHSFSFKLRRLTEISVQGSLSVVYGKITSLALSNLT